MFKLSPIFDRTNAVIITSVFSHVLLLVHRRPALRARPTRRSASPSYLPLRSDRAADESAARSSPAAAPPAPQVSVPARHRATASTIRATRTSGSTPTSPAHTAGQVVCSKADKSPATNRIIRKPYLSLLLALDRTIAHELFDIEHPIANKAIIYDQRPSHVSNSYGMRPARTKIIA